MAEDNGESTFEKNSLFSKLKLMSSKTKIIIVSVLSLLLIFGSIGFNRYKNYQYDKYINLAKTSLKNENFDESINDYKLAVDYNSEYNCYNDVNNVNNMKNSKSNYILGIEDFNKKDYEKAYEELKIVIAKDEKRYSDAIKKLEVCGNEIVKNKLDLAKRSMQKQDYNTAIEYLNFALEVQPNNQEISQLKSQCNDTIAKIKADADAKAKAEQDAKDAQALAEEKAKYAPQKIVDSNGKQIWKIYISNDSLHFTGTYKGTGNFIVKLSDNNQNLVELIANEIGDYISDKTVSVPYVGWYYLEVDSVEGACNYNWQ